MLRDIQTQPLFIANSKPLRGSRRRARFKCMTDPMWEYAELTSEISVAFSRALQRVGHRRYPLYFNSAMSAEIFELWLLHRTRPMESNKWELIPTREPPLVFEGRSHLFLVIAAGNTATSPSLAAL